MPLCAWCSAFACALHGFNFVCVPEAVSACTESAIERQTRLQIPAPIFHEAWHGAPGLLLHTPASSVLSFQLSYYFTVCMAVHAWLFRLSGGDIDIVNSP